MTPEETLAKATRLFANAQTRRRPSPKYRTKIENLLRNFWQETTGKGREAGSVTVLSSHLYLLLHQAVQTLPSPDEG